jgi:hypothetical protein
MSAVGTSSLIGIGIALLAFVTAFYALLARERKTPYITNFIFPPAGILFAGVLLSLAVQFLQTVQPAIPVGAATRVDVAIRIVNLAALILLAIGVTFTSLNIWRLHNRQVNFRDDHRIKNIRVVRWIKRKIRQFRDETSYAHATIKLDPQQVNSALQQAGIGLAGTQAGKLATIAICRRPFSTTDRSVTLICSALLNHGWYVQYTTCIRHPQDFIEQLQAVLGHKWNDSKMRIAVADAYTPHFGFTDSIHEDKTLEVKRSGVKYVRAKDSYAGVHTATAKAFNALKSIDKKVRKPTFLIYEGANALTDLESVEQYRVFARHVLTSERMWGGMLTLFLEPTVGEDEMELLRVYADLFVPTAEVDSGKRV